MSDKPERFSSAQIAMAALGAAVLLIIVLLAVMVWNSASR
jgi:hypothetical protein